MSPASRPVIGILVPDLSITFYAELARGASDMLWTSGCSAVLCETTGTPAREAHIFEMLVQMAAAGVVVCAPSLPDADLATRLCHFDGAVLIDRDAPGGCAGRLWVDRDDGLRQAVAHLAERGRQHIGYLASVQSLTCAAGVTHAHAAKALSGALETAGLASTSGQLVVCNATWESGYMAARALLVRAPDVDALICGSDVAAVGALHACASLGKRVPSDIAVVGSDDDLIARVVRPALTTLHIPKYQAGTMAAQMLLDRVGGVFTSRDRVIAQRLVVRASAP